MPSTFLNAKSRVFAGANPFEVSEYVSRNVASHQLRVSRASQRSASLSYCKAGSLDLCRLSYGAQARVLTEGLADTYHLQFILRGHCRYELPHRTLELAAGQLLVINPQEPIDLTYSEDCEKFIVKVPAGMLNKACEEPRWLKASGAVKFNQVSYRFEELDSLMMLLNLLCDEAESGFATPQMLQHYTNVVTTKLLAMLKHNVCSAEPGQHSACFERLARYIEQNIKHDLTAEQLAQHARMSLRSLYSLFEKNVRMTPKHFIRQKKLEQVHAALTDPGARAPNVTAVALEYGFTHLGRFSELYRSMYGALPSESMKKCRQGVVAA